MFEKNCENPGYLDWRATDTRLNLSISAEPIALKPCNLKQILLIFLRTKILFKNGTRSMTGQMRLTKGPRTNSL